MTRTCKARQYSDQMMCQCGLAWDVNDPEPPACPSEVQQWNSTNSTQQELSTSSPATTVPPSSYSLRSKGVSCRTASCKTEPSGRRLRIALDLLRSANRYVGQNGSIRAQDLSREICEFIAEQPSC